MTNLSILSLCHLSGFSIRVVLALQKELRSVKVRSWQETITQDGLNKETLMRVCYRMWIK